MLILYIAIICLFSLGQVGRLSLLGQQVNGYYYEILSGLLLISLVFKYRFKPIACGFIKYRSLLIFLSILAISLIISAAKFSVLENAVAGLYLVRLIFYFVFLVYLEYWIKHDRQVKWERILLVLFGLIALSSSVQYLLYKDLRNLLYLGWDPHYYRLFGVFLDTSVAAAIYGMTFLYLFLNPNRFIHFARFRYLLLTLYFLFGLFTLSRSFYIVFFLTMLLILFHHKKIRLIGWLTIAFVLIIYLIPKPGGAGVDLLRMFSINSRLDNYTEALKVWSGNPIIGIGYNHIRYVRYAMGLIETQDLATSHSGASFHSSFLIVLATSGILGISAFFAALWTLAKKNKTTLALIFLLSGLSLTDNILLHPFVLFYFILLYCSLR